MRAESRDEKKRGPDPEGAEAWLRARLEPTPQQVDRVVRHALLGEAVPAGRHPLSWALSAAMAMAILALAFLGLDHFGPRPARLGRETARPGSVGAIITNASGKVELIRPPAATQRRAGQAGNPTPQGGTVRVFNSDGCLCAMLPTGRVRYYIIGGDA